MKYPSLKYYIESKSSLKLKIFISELAIREIKIDKTSFTGLEYQFFFSENPCETQQLDFITHVIKTISKTLSKTPTVDVESLKSLFRLPMS